jgi:hypothetical protein
VKVLSMFADQADGRLRKAYLQGALVPSALRST